MTLGRENGGHRTVAIVLLLMNMILCVLMTQNVTSQECPSGDFKTEEGVCCQKCAQGFRLVEKCHNNGERTKCEPCPAGQFSNQMNHDQNCRRCTKCKFLHNEIELSECKATQNTICRCKDGFYKYTIDSESFECRKCAKCGPNENETQRCAHEMNTVCECKENYYLLKDKCQLCKSCTPECKHLCLTTDPTKGTNHYSALLVNVIAGSAVTVVVLLSLGVFITYMATKRFTQKKLQSQPTQPADSHVETCKHLLINVQEPSEDTVLNFIVPEPPGEQESPKLPDCVPLEIRIPDLIYAVLEVVPVQQMKQLARRLGVKDTEIEQVEMDHRSCREAHYQMLRIWAQRGPRTPGGGREEMVHQPLFEELLDKLRQMHLGRAAEELETKYSIQ